MDVALLQTALRDHKLDGWLFYDHHHRDPIAYRILGLDEQSFVSRRWYYFVPADGAPQKLVHRIESGKLDTLPGQTHLYSSWQELESSLRAMLGTVQTVAMQYSPRNAILYVSMVDAGTVELVRSFGTQVVSSADLVAQFEAVLSEAQIATHLEAQRRLDPVLRAGWQHISDEVRSGRDTDEFSVVNFLREAIARAGLFTDHGPNCSVGPNSADSHYEPTAASSRAIRSGDFVLIDIWARLAEAANPQAPLAGSVWYDITWTGVIGREPTAREQLVFNTVRDARDSAIACIESAFARNEQIAGWQADDAARDVVRAAGFGEFFTHRTGHNIAVELHGNGAHLDNLETHDERLILPNTCFSVEPGIYFPAAEFGAEAFGMRNEVNMITRPGKVSVTGPRQNALLRL
jgi:Xaa-Pro dipeptidase